MLTKMRLENFKSWRELELDLSNITILFGTNSSGKSNILKSLLLLKELHLREFDWNFSMFSVWSPLHHDKFAVIDFGSFQDAVFAHAVERKIGIGLDWDNDSYMLRWQQQEKRVQDISDAQDLPFGIAFDSLSKHIFHLAPKRADPERRYIGQSTLPQSIGVIGENTVEMLLASERNQIDLFTQVSKWLKKLDLVSEFRIKVVDDGRWYELCGKVCNSRIETSLIDMGLGVWYGLALVTLLFSVPQNSIVLLEYPEIQLHPNVQAHLADLFLHVAETRKLQLIIESHSEHLLARLQRRIAEVEQPFATPEHIKMYFCKMTEDGSKLEPVNVDKYGQIANWPDDFFGDISGDIEAMSRAGLKRRRQELEEEQRRRELSSND